MDVEKSFKVLIFSENFLVFKCLLILSFFFDILQQTGFSKSPFSTLKTLRFLSLRYSADFRRCRLLLSFVRLELNLNVPFFGREVDVFKGNPAVSGASARSSRNLFREFANRTRLKRHISIFRLCETFFEKLSMFRKGSIFSATNWMFTKPKRPLFIILALWEFSK